MEEEEEIVIKKERRLVGRKPWEYPDLQGITELLPDTGFGKAGAKLDPSSGALKYDKYEDIELRKRLQRQKPEPEPIPEPRPSSIRFSLDSHAMIHIKEDEEVSIASNGQLQDHFARGTLSVRNLSDKDRLWDINVMLREDSGLAIVDFDEVKAIELEPGTKVSEDYQISNYAPSINVHEIISTHQDYPESVILKKDKKTHVTFELGLKNISKNPYNNIVLRKNLPKNLKDPILPESGSENVSISDNKLIWRIDELDQGEVKAIMFEGDIEPEMATEIPIGDIDIEATGKDTITRFIVTSYNAMCRNMYYIEADETDEPGSWFCRFVCENTSSFEVEILKVEIRDSTTNQLYLNLSNPGIMVPPNKRWESESWIVEGKERPSFIKNLILNVIPGITKEMNFKLTKEGGIFKVGSLKFSKSFDKNKAVAGRITDLGVQIEIENTGSAALEHLVVRDSLPRFIARPTNLVVERGSAQLTENIRYSVIPEDAAADNDKELSIFINDLSKFGGALTKGEKVVITYDTQIYRPAPQEKIEAGADVAGKPYLPGPVLTADAAGAIPTVNILQILRKFSIGKSIEQGTSIGEYNIGLLYQNRGNQPIKNLVIKDILPKNFMGSDYTLDPEQEPTVDQGMILTWNIPLLKEGEITKIRYKIKGEGEYHPSDAQIFYNYTPE
jgi:hypothetical protein